MSFCVSMKDNSYLLFILFVKKIYDQVTKIFCSPFCTVGDGLDSAFAGKKKKKKKAVRVFGFFLHLFSNFILLRL